MTILTNQTNIIPPPMPGIPTPIPVLYFKSPKDYLITTEWPCIVVCNFLARCHWPYTSFKGVVYNITKWPEVRNLEFFFKLDPPRGNRPPKEIKPPIGVFFQYIETSNGWDTVLSVDTHK
jgi:hypothetical protein